MIVTVKLGGPLRKKVLGHKHGELSLDLEPGATVTAALTQLGLEVSGVRVIMLGGRPVSEDLPLSHGDRLALFPAEMAAINELAIYFSHGLGRGHVGGV